MRYDHMLIMSFVEKGSKVLDLGCGNGELLYALKKEKGVNGRGIDIKEEKIAKCFEKGLSAIHLDIDKGLSDYNDKVFDYVILNDTLQAVKRPVTVVKEAARIGKKIIITFPNFAHYSIRLNLLLTGRMPKSKTLPYEWYDTPNIHLFTIKDFIMLCKKNDFRIINSVYYNKSNQTGLRINLHPNFFAKNALFVINSKALKS